MGSCPHEFIDLANRLADTAGDIQRQHFRDRVPVEIKPDGSPVTQADKDSERVLRELIEKTYPNHGIAGEEYPTVRENAEYTWVLDPIDGTKSFLAGIPMFGILIALAHHGRFTLGVVDQPILRDRWVGANGHDTTFNGTAVRTRQCGSLADAVLCISGPEDRTKPYDDQIANLRHAVKWARYGAECYAYGLLASGFIDLIVDVDLDGHDFGPLDPVVGNAGGIATDWQGNPLTMNSDGRIIVAGDARLLKDTIACLNR
jgi:inositol-phosphate phosphatase/L-galactose 1-phosphate phosphatase/histidinol-phosphatase